MTEQDFFPPASAEEAEARIIAAGQNLLLKRLEDGTATASEVVAALNLGTAKTRLETTKLERECQLLTAKTAQLETAGDLERITTDALNAFRGQYVNTECDPTRGYWG